MMEYLNTTKQLNYNHHAYRKNMSTTTTILQLSDTIFEAADRNKVTALMTIDKERSL